MFNKLIIFILLSLLSVQASSDDTLSEARERTDAYKAYLKQNRSAYQRQLGARQLPEDATIEERRRHAVSEHERISREAREIEDPFEKQLAEERARLKAMCDSLEPDKRSRTVSCM